MKPVECLSIYMQAHRRLAHSRLKCTNNYICVWIYCSLVPVCAFSRYTLALVIKKIHGQYNIYCAVFDVTVAMKLIHAYIVIYMQSCTVQEINIYIYAGRQFNGGGEMLMIANHWQAIRVQRVQMSRIMRDLQNKAFGQRMTCPVWYAIQLFKRYELCNLFARRILIQGISQAIVGLKLRGFTQRGNIAQKGER